MRQRHLERVQAGKISVPYRDYISPRNPALKYLAEQATDVYLHNLTDNERADLMSLNERLLGANVTIVHDQSINILKTTDNMDMQSRYSVVQQKNLPSQFTVIPILSQMSRDKRELSPGIWTEFQSENISVTMTRTGFTDTGRFEIIMIDASGNRAVQLDLTEEQFDRFVATGDAGRIRLEKWEAVTTPSVKEWQKNVNLNSYQTAFENADRAQAATKEGGKEKTFAGVIIDALASPDIQVLLPDDVVQRDKTTGQVYGTLFLQEYIYVGV